VASQPKSYSVETTNGTPLLRNRRFVCPAQETVSIPTESVKHDDSGTTKTCDYKT